MRRARSSARNAPKPRGRRRRRAGCIPAGPAQKWAGVAGMTEIERFSALVGDMYDASLDPSLWPTVFEQVCEYVRGVMAHLYAHDCVRRTQNNFFCWGDN